MISGRKLLIADDSVTIQKVVDLTFTDEGMEVTTVGDGDQAIASLEQFAPDVVLADVFMPGRTGYQVCEAIKHSERFHNIPVMLLVGSFEPFDEAEARRVGADDVLTKPFQSIRELVNRVGTLLGGKPAEGEEPTQQLSNLDLDEPPAEVGQAESHHEGAAVGADWTSEEPAAEVTGEESPDELMSTAEIELTTADTLPLVELEKEKSEAVAYVSDADRHGPQSEATLDAAAPFAASNTASDQDRAYWAQRLADESQPAGQKKEPEQPLRVEHMEKPSEQQRATTNADEFDDLLLDLDDLDSAPARVTADDAVLELEDDAPQVVSLDDIPYATEVEPKWAEAAAGQSFQEAASSEQELGAAWAIVPPPAPFERVTDHDSSAALADQAALYKQQASYEDPASAHLSNMTWVEEVSKVATQSDEYGSQGERVAQPGSVSESTGPRLSPADIDAIARRVVEHMSEQTIREIAWEVVPELAELMIKRRLEET